MGMLALCIESLTDFLFPRTANEERLLSLTPEELFTRLPRAAHISHEAFALFEYTHKEVKDLVWRVKYKGDRAVAEKLGILLYDALIAELEENQLVEKHGGAILLSVPTSTERHIERGWNQAELLAAAVAKCDRSGSTLTYLPHALSKVRHTESQTHTSGRSERLENLRGSMAASDAVRGRLCVIIDDVCTTGATFTEARRALREAGARKVICLTVAH